MPATPQLPSCNFTRYRMMRQRVDFFRADKPASRCFRNQQNATRHARIRWAAVIHLNCGNSFRAVRSTPVPARGLSISKRNTPLPDEPLGGMKKAGLPALSEATRGLAHQLAPFATKIKATGLVIQAVAVTYETASCYNKPD